MKNLFKLSNLFCVLFAFIIAMASCQKRNITQSGNSEKLEKLSAELENNNRNISLNNSKLLGGEMKNSEEEFSVSTQAGIKINEVKGPKDPLVIAAGTKSVKKLSPKQQRKLEIMKAKAEGKRGGGLSQRMKLGIILAAVGLLVALLIGWPIYIIGVIVFIIGAVLIIMELVNY